MSRTPTEDEKYKTEADEWFFDLDFSSGSYTRLNYSNAVPLSVVMGEGVFHWAPSSGSFYDAEQFLDNIYKKKAKNDIFMGETGGGGSFSVRSPAGGAFL